MVSWVGQGGHGCDPDCEEGGSEDVAVTQRDRTAGERAETAALYFAIVLDIETVIPADGGIAGHESGEEKMNIENKELQGLSAVW